MKDEFVYKILDIIKDGKAKMPKGRVAIIDVAHDLWCPVFRGGRCICDPDVTIRPGMPEHDNDFGDIPDYTARFTTPNSVLLRKCPQCGEIIRGAGAFKVDHFRARHPEYKFKVETPYPHSSQRRYICEICGDSFGNFTDLVEKHRHAQVGVESRQF